MLYCRNRGIFLNVTVGLFSIRNRRIFLNGTVRLFSIRSHLRIMPRGSIRTNRNCERGGVPQN